MRWLVKEGDLLKEDQPMVEVMTDKATVEIGSPRAGRVAQRLFAEGERCPVGKVLIVIEVEGDAAAGDASPQPERPRRLRAAAPVTQASQDRQWCGDWGGGVWPRRRRGSWRVTSASTSVRSPGAAAPAESPPTTLRPSPHGAPRRVTARLATGPAGKARRDPTSIGEADGVRMPFRGLRKKIAEKLVRSKQTAPHFTYVEEIDCTELVAAARAAEPAAGRRCEKLSFLALHHQGDHRARSRSFPQLNAMLDEAGGEIVQWSSFHIGLATATENGLIVPVVRDADRKSLAELGREIERLGRGDPHRQGRRARSSSARPSPSPAWARWAA